MRKIRHELLGEGSQRSNKGRRIEQKVEVVNKKNTIVFVSTPTIGVRFDTYLTHIDICDGTCGDVEVMRKELSKMIGLRVNNENGYPVVFFTKKEIDKMEVK